MDRDVVQEEDSDQQHHYRTGDVVELFLKPKEAPYYWEFYPTPQGRRTVFFAPSRGRFGLPSNLPVSYDGQVRVAASVDGTINDWQSPDVGWCAEISVPLA